MDKSSKIYVAGHRGMVGSAIIRRLNQLVDNDDDLYFKMLREPHFNKPKSKDLEHKSVIEFFEKIISEI